MNTAMRRRKGFTLIELLAVMGIMILMATVALVSYFGATRGAAIRSAASHLQDTLRFARQTAILNRKRAYVMFREEDGAYVYAVCLHHGTGTGSGVTLAPDEYSDWSGIVSGGRIWNLNDGTSSVVSNVYGTSFTTVDSIWSGTSRYGWEIQPEMYLPRNIVVMHKDEPEGTLPETVIFSSDGTVRVDPYEIWTYESIPGMTEPVRVTIKVAGLTGFTSVHWPESE